MSPLIGRHGNNSNTLGAGFDYSDPYWVPRSCEWVIICATLTEYFPRRVRS